MPNETTSRANGRSPSNFLAVHQNQVNLAGLKHLLLFVKVQKTTPKNLPKWRTDQRRLHRRWRGQPMNESQPKRKPVQDSRQRQVQVLLGLFAFLSDNFQHFCF